MSIDVIEGSFTEAPRPLAVQASPAAPQLLDALRPAERVALLAEISNVVQDVIAKQGWFKQIGPKKHIYIQGWTFIGGLGGCSVKTTHTEKIDGGYKAHAVVVRVDTGIEVGAADQVCMTNEAKWKGKDEYALIGMASTRACSRALSTVFRHVVELAGYSATPAEEMFTDEKPHVTAPQNATKEQHGEVQALAKSLGLKIVPWTAANVVPGFDKRSQPVLSVAEYHLVKAALEKLIPAAQAHVAEANTARRAEAAPVDDGSKMTPRSQGRLFALLDERLSTDKESRLAFAAEHGIVIDSFSKLTELQARTLIRQLEMIPPPSEADADDMLAEYAEGRLL